MESEDTQHQAVNLIETYPYYLALEEKTSIIRSLVFKRTTSS